MKDKKLTTSTSYLRFGMSALAVVMVLTLGSCKSAEETAAAPVNSAGNMESPLASETANEQLQSKSPTNEAETESGATTATSGRSAVAEASLPAAGSSTAAVPTSGEYRPADEHGPARNVPKPIEPEGMNTESEEGLVEFIHYWNDWRNYALQTGDTSVVSQLVHNDYTQEINFYESLETIYSEDGWVVGGYRSVSVKPDSLINKGGGEYAITAKFEVAPTVLWLAGEASAYDFSDENSKDLKISAEYISGDWVIKSVDGVGHE